MWQSWLVLLLATVCLAQRQPSNNSGERQIRLEDIERDNLAASQKPVAPAPASAGAQVASSPPQVQATFLFLLRDFVTTIRALKEIFQRIFVDTYIIEFYYLIHYILELFF